MKWKKKVAWITGASSGIGRALALELARQGAEVVISGRRLERLKSLHAEISVMGGRAHIVPCDVSVEASIRDAVASIIHTCGALHVVIANAGWALRGDIEELSMDDWERQFKTNVFGAALTARYALPHLRETGGRIGLVGSVSSMVPTPAHGAYTASKYALRGLGQTLSLELTGSGVSCTLLHPGFVASEVAQVDNHGVFQPQRIDKRPSSLMWTADKAARVMLGALHKRKREYVFTLHGKFAGFLGRHLPDVMYMLLRKKRFKTFEAPSNTAKAQQAAPLPRRKA